MATQAASLFSPTLSGEGVAAAPWKHQSSAALRPIRAAASHRPIRAKVEPEAPAGFTPSPIEELYVITWESPKEQVFEMPSGGAAIMRRGPNLLKLARKEQCLALGTNLRSKFKINYQFYRVFPNGEVHYLHPNDGVYPEKVNAGREECQPH